MDKIFEEQEHKEDELITVEDANTPASNIFKAYKEQVLNVKTNSTAIKVSGNSGNVVDLGILCDSGQIK